jgi:hypothetical protein
LLFEKKGSEEQGSRRNTRIDSIFKWMKVLDLEQATA